MGINGGILRFSLPIICHSRTNPPSTAQGGGPRGCWSSNQPSEFGKASESAKLGGSFGGPLPCSRGSALLQDRPRAGRFGFVVKMPLLVEQRVV